MSEDPDDLRAQIVQAAVRGWEANLDGRSVGAPHHVSPRHSESDSAQ